MISPYYDSLLVKVTTWDSTFEGECRKAIRAVREIHVRGVKTNIAFILNILHDEVFRAAPPYEVHRRDSQPVPIG